MTIHVCLNYQKPETTKDHMILARTTKLVLRLHVLHDCKGHAWGRYCMLLRAPYHVFFFLVQLPDETCNKAKHSVATESATPLTVYEFDTEQNNLSHSSLYFKHAHTHIQSPQPQSRMSIDNQYYDEFDNEFDNGGGTSSPLLISETNLQPNANTP